MVLRHLTTTIEDNPGITPTKLWIQQHSYYPVLRNAVKLSGLILTQRSCAPTPKSAVASPGPTVFTCTLTLFSLWRKIATHLRLRLRKQLYTSFAALRQR